MTPWSVACQALLSVGFPGQEYLSGLPFDECSILSLYWSFYYYIMSLFWGFPDGSDSKDSACNEGPGFDPWVGKTPWNRPWQPTPVFSSGESKDSPEGYSPWGRNTLYTTEWLSTHYRFLSFFINFVSSLFCLTWVLWLSLSCHFRWHGISFSIPHFQSMCLLCPKVNLF